MPLRSRRSGRRTFRSLRQRNFRLFFMGQLVSQVGTWLTMIALTLLVLSLTHSGVAIGLLAACQFLPVLLFGAYGGLVADRSDKRRLLVITQTLEMGQSALLAALAFMPHPPVWAFYVISLAGGCMLAFDNPARRSFVSEMVPPDDIQNAVTLNSALMTGSRVIGPAIAGALVVTVGYGWCFTIDAVSYLTVIAALLAMRTSELRPTQRVMRAKGQLREAFRYVVHAVGLWVPLVMVTVVGTLTFNFSVVLPLFVENSLGGTATQFTILFSVLSVGSVCGSLTVARLERIDLFHLVVAAFAFGITMAVLACMPNLASALVVALAVGTASVAFVTSSTAIVQLRTAPMMRGRVLALQSMVFLGSTPLGGPLLGWVSDAWGARVAIAVGAVAAIGAGAFGLYARRRWPAAEASDAEDIDLRERVDPTRVAEAAG